MTEQRIEGLRPWLPWPLRHWRGWTEPVRAERLAALRIGLAVVLFLDILLTYWPNVTDFFGADSLSHSPGLDPFSNYTRWPRWNWSILRGLGHPTNWTLMVGMWLLATIWLWAKLSSTPDGEERSGPGVVPWLWSMASALAVVSTWVRLELLPSDTSPTLAGCLAFATALVAWGLAFVWLWLYRRRSRRWFDASLWAAWAIATVLLLAGVERWRQLMIDGDAGWRLRELLTDWDQNSAVVRGAMVAWLVAAALLALGLATRVAAIAAWALANSFDNLVPSINNNGDVVRNILLFYLMVSPCGAAWSVDAFIKRKTRPVFIHPWILRLLMLQMIVIYFFNGAYKLFGTSWTEGDSLYYVLANPTMTRVSYAQFPLPAVVLRVLTYTVLAWELAFGLLVAWRRTRVTALVLGALFHLGIWAALELGFFSAYMLTMYLPLVPWEGRRPAAAMKG